MTSNDAIGLFMILISAVGLGFVALEVFVPSLPTRWQVSSTRKAATRKGALAGSKVEVGQFFQRGLGIDPDGEPWKDPVVLRRVRWIGAALAAFCACFLTIGIIILQRSP